MTSLFSISLPSWQTEQLVKLDCTTEPEHGANESSSGQLRELGLDGV